MAQSFGDIYWSSDLLMTEKEKNSFEFISSKIDHFIQQYVYTKRHITKARNMYEGRRDTEDFQYITDAYGLSNAIDLAFTPIAKPRIDILIGEMLRTTFRMTVTVLDTDTLDKIENDREKGRLKALLAFAQQELNQSKSDNESPPAYLDSQVRKLERKFGKSFKSNYVKSVEVLIKFFKEGSQFDLKQKLKQFFLDLVLTGEAYYRIYTAPYSHDPIFEVIKPENIYFNKNTNSQYLDQTDCVVHREYYTRQQVLEKFGYMLSDDDLKNLFSSWSQIRSSNYPRYSRDDVRTVDAIGDIKGSYFNQWSFNPYETVEVFHVEFTSHNKVKGKDGKVTPDDFNIDPIKAMAFPRPSDNTTGSGGGVTGKKWRWREDRYEGYRIGQNVYFGLGKTKNVHRSQASPFKAGYSYDGVSYNDRNGEPYSLGLALAPIQDRYDLLMYFRDNYIANSGVKGSRTNLAAIPTVLGNTFTERITKYISYKKQGLDLIDTSQPGGTEFNHYGDFDNSIDGNGLQAVQATLLSLEAQADTLTGINRPMLGNIEEKDAVSNVKVGIERSSLIIKDYFELLRIMEQRMFNRFIKVGQTLYSKGKQGSIMLGSNQVTFKVIPKDFIYSDFGIHLSNNDEDIGKLDKVYGITQELAKAQMITPDIMLKTVSYDSIVSVIDEIEEAVAKNKREQGQLAELNKALEDSGSQIKELKKQVQKLQAEVQRANKQHYDLEDRKVRVLESKLDEETKTGAIERYNKKVVNEKDLDLKRRIVELEKEELYLSVDKPVGNRAEVKNKLS